MSTSVRNCACLVVQSLTRVFEYFGDREFAVFGTNIADAKRWWRSVDIVRATVPASTFPMLNGGIHYFKKSALAQEIFDRAQRLVRLRRALAVSHGRRPPERRTPW